MNYWKVAILEENDYVVRKAGLKQKQAKELVQKLTKKGLVARASKSLNPKKEYYYGD